MSAIGKYLIIVGAVILLTGIIFTFLPKNQPFWKLPGDIYIRRENFTFYFPVTTSIIVSILISFILWLINFFGRK
ncbi:MAG: DUF2905 domain-containing protein [Ignavibacteria bacterium]|nr:DUF2905 domain-containing protein [Ignavibacteria bacterium]